jgi:hypothetical protein
VTAITMPMPFDPVAEVRAILASIDELLSGVAQPTATPQPKAVVKAAVKRSKSMMLGCTKVTRRRTPSGFAEPVFTTPKSVDTTKIDSLATYHKRLMAMGCEPIGTDEATGATVYRTPDGTVLKVRAAWQGQSLETVAMKEGTTRSQLGEALANAKQSYAHAKRIKSRDTSAEYDRMAQAQGEYDRFNDECGVGH